MQAHASPSSPPQAVRNFPGNSSGFLAAARQTKQPSVAQNSTMMGIVNGFQRHDSTTSPFSRLTTLRVQPVVGQGSDVKAKNNDGGIRHWQIQKRFHRQYTTNKASAKVRPMFVMALLTSLCTT